MKWWVFILLALALVCTACANSAMPPHFHVLGLLPLTLVFSFILSVLLESFAAALYLKNTSRRVIVSVVIANIIVVPLFNILLVVSNLLLQASGFEFGEAAFFWPVVLLLEIGVVVCESKLLQLLNKKDFTDRSALKLSFVMNLFSFVVGTSFMYWVFFGTPFPY